jgi:MFS family permease
MTTSWTRIFLLYGIGVLSAGQLGIVPPLVPALQRDLGLSLAAAGTAVSIVTLIGAVFGLLAGGWCEKVGHVRALGLGMTIMAAAAALCAVSRGSGTLLAARGLAGAGYLLVIVAGPSLMATTSDPRHQPITLSCGVPSCRSASQPPASRQRASSKARVGDEFLPSTRRC